MSNTTASLPKLMTVEEFLAWPGDGSGVKYELVEGKLRAMAASSDTQGTIHANLGADISTHLRANMPKCRVSMGAGIEPHFRAQWNFRIPDLGVTRTPNRQGLAMIPDPMLLVDVLSPSNRADTWNNIALYTTIPSVREIFVVDSEVVKVEVLRRLPDRNWARDVDTIIGLSSTVRLDTIGLTIPLSAIYADTWLMSSPTL